MLQGVLNQPVSEHFTVSDVNGNPITGLLPGSFTLYVYDPVGIEVSGSVSGSITELGSGNYKYVFTPNSEGTWYVNAVHATYFPWGKAGDVQVFSGDLSDIYNGVVETLGLIHRNIYIDQTIYDEHGNLSSARVRIYSDSVSVGSDSNVIGTYTITSSSSETGKFDFWKQVKV
ncbi:MAG: hypothetical protein KGD64_08265 [Candidatus Heimdallarchaeota archaeon]|nr:hypothetical protein [Candidatus Heimdallarchaeota archaeon]